MGEDGGGTSKPKEGNSIKAKSRTSQTMKTLLLTKRWVQPLPSLQKVLSLTCHFCRMPKNFAWGRFRERCLSKPRARLWDIHHWYASAPSIASDTSVAWIDDPEVFIREVLIQKILPQERGWWWSLKVAAFAKISILTDCVDQPKSHLAKQFHPLRQAAKPFWRGQGLFNSSSAIQVNWNGSLHTCSSPPYSLGRCLCHLFLVQFLSL